MSRALGALTAAVALAILSPLARDRSWDDFPISSYPMFSRGDLGAVVPLGHALLVAPDGTTRPAPPALVGTPEPMVAKNLVEGAIARGAAADLCARIAARAREETPDAARVVIVTSVFDTRRYFREPGGRTPLSREVHASCNVPR